MNSLPTFEPYVLTPFDHLTAPIHISPFLTFCLDNPRRAIPILEAGVLRLIELLPFLAGNVTPSNKLHGKENVLEVQPPSAEFLQRFPMMKIKYHQKSISPQNSGPTVNYDLIMNEDFVPLPYELSAEALSPVFRFQANVMLDGVIVCFTFHHMALDGIGTANVMKALAACCRDPRANLDSLPTNCWQEMASRRAIFEAASVSGMSRIDPIQEPDDWHLSLAMTPNSTISRQLMMDAFKIEQLKKACIALFKNRLAAQGLYLSSTSIVSAVLWLCFIRARYGQAATQSEPETAKSCLVSISEVRNKLEPSLPMSYMGNALVMMQSHACIRPIIASFNEAKPKLDSRSPNQFDPQDVHHIAELAFALQETLKGVTDQQIRGVISRVVASDDWTSNNRPGDLSISSIRSFKLYEIDFGPCLGPVKDFDIPESRISGFTWIKAARFDFAPWEVRITLDPAVMERIQNDTLMRLLDPREKSKL